MRTPLIAGNWKMNMTLAPARDLVAGVRQAVEKLSGVDILICPPFQLLFPMAKAIAGSRIMLGAQNVHEASTGAFTGEISAEMLKDTGCTYVIIGHSERRHLFDEASPRLAGKVRAAAAVGLQVIYCVGETLSERESGRTESVVGTQLDEVVRADVPPDRLILAYEPVWAIGTGRNATPAQAREVHAFLRRKLAEVYGDSRAATMRILYGGSVKPDNAEALLGETEIDGALVGGACLVARDFAAIIATARRRRAGS